MSTTTVTEIPAGTYGLDPVHSSIGFGVRYNGLATFRSTFEKFDAALTDGVLTGTADVDSIAVDEPSFKGHLLTGDFFDAESTPTITFRSTGIKVAEDGKAEVAGELTIKGTTKSVVATGDVAAGADAFGNDRAAFQLSTTIDRREFGIDWQNALPNGDDSLAWDVTITVDLQLLKQA
jgi:polyisoprenoid-binding protein YceI